MTQARVFLKLFLWYSTGVLSQSWPRLYDQSHRFTLSREDLDKAQLLSHNRTVLVLGAAWSTYQPLVIIVNLHTSHPLPLLWFFPSSSSSIALPGTRCLSAFSHFFSISYQHTQSSRISVIMRGLAGLALLPLLASASPVVNVRTIHNDAAPILSSTQSKEIPDSYIIVFKKHVSQTSAAAHHDWVQDLHLSTRKNKRSQIPFSADILGGLKHTYDIVGGLLGYSGHFDEDVIERIRRHPDVSHQILPQLARTLSTSL